MTNKEIIEKVAQESRVVVYGAFSNELTRIIDLARADEREKMTEDKFAEYFNTLKGGEVASAILTQLLRKGITDDDLRGLRLQWIKEKPEGVDVWVSVDEDGTTKLSESELEFFEREKWGMFKYPERGFCVALPHQFGEFLKVEEGECAKFKIVRQP